MSDYSKLRFPDGQRILEAYNDPQKDERVACKLESGGWGLYYPLRSEWWADQAIGRNDLDTGGWGPILTNTFLIYTASDNKVADKVADRCVCDIRDLMREGCTLDKTGHCRSKL